MKKVDVSNKVNSFFNIAKTKIKNAGKLMGRKVVSLYNAIKGLPGKVNKMFHATMEKVSSTVRGKKAPKIVKEPKGIFAKTTGAVTGVFARITSAIRLDDPHGV